MYIHTSGPFAIIDGDTIGIGFKYHIHDTDMTTPKHTGVFIVDTDVPASHNGLCKIDAELKKGLRPIPWPTHKDILNHAQ